MRIDVNELEDGKFRFFWSDHIEHVVNHLVLFRSSNDDELSGRVVAIHVDIASLFKEDVVEGSERRLIFERVRLHIRFGIRHTAGFQFVDEIFDRLMLDGRAANDKALLRGVELDLER